MASNEFRVQQLIHPMVDKRFQSIKHAKFGIGIVQLIEKNGAKTHLTIKFKAGLKKIDSSFIQII